VLLELAAAAKVVDVNGRRRGVVAGLVREAASGHLLGHAGESAQGAHVAGAAV
jgi:hypothetical protein